MAEQAGHTVAIYEDEFGKKYYCTMVDSDPNWKQNYSWLVEPGLYQTYLSG